MSPGDAFRAAKDAVLVDLEAALLADAAQRDVVRLGAGEVEERRAEARRRHDAQIDLQAAAQADARPRRAARQNSRGIGVADETLDDGATIAVR